MRELTGVMKEAEGWLDAFLQGEIGEDEWRDARGEERRLVADGREGLASWAVDGSTLLPAIEIKIGEDRYSVEMKKTPCPDVVIYEWQCWDAFGVSDSIDRACACRGKIIFP